MRASALYAEMITFLEIIHLVIRSILLTYSNMCSHLSSPHNLHPHSEPGSDSVLFEPNTRTLVIIGMCSSTEDEGKLQRASPPQRRTSGDSNSCLILEPDRLKGECSEKGADLPLSSDVTGATCLACAKCGKYMWWGAELLRDSTLDRKQDTAEQLGRRQPLCPDELVKQVCRGLRKALHILVLGWG